VATNLACDISAAFVFNNLRLSRRMNDAVAWGLVVRRDLVRQLGAHHVRPTLIESNPASVGPGVEPADGTFRRQAE